jgi:hypothetical protein
VDTSDGRHLMIETPEPTPEPTEPEPDDGGEDGE